MREGPLACSLDSIAAAAGQSWSHETNADSRWVLLAYELVFALVQPGPTHGFVIGNCISIGSSTSYAYTEEGVFTRREHRMGVSIERPFQLTPFSPHSKWLLGLLKEQSIVVLCLLLIGTRRRDVFSIFMWRRVEGGGLMKISWSTEQ